MYIQVPELASHANVMNIGLARQTSLLSNLPDFTTLMELNTPTLATNSDSSFNFSLEDEQAIMEQINFRNIEVTTNNEQSMYPTDSYRHSDTVSQLKNMQLVDVVPLPPQAMVNASQQTMNDINVSMFNGEHQVKYEPLSPNLSQSSSSPSSPSSGGLDSETENDSLVAVGDGTDVSMTTLSSTTTDNTHEQEIAKINRCCSQMKLPRGK